MVPNKGTFVPAHNAEIRNDYAVAISKALREELGTSARATKTVMRWTGVSDRAAKYWLSGMKAPGGWQLVLLAKNSDAVLHAFLRMANRDLFKLSIELNAAQASLARAAAIIKALRSE